MKRHPVIITAANIALSKMDPMRFLTSTDQMEIMAMKAVSELVQEAYEKANKS